MYYISEKIKFEREFIFFSFIFKNIYQIYISDNKYISSLNLILYLIYL